MIMIMMTVTAMMVMGENLKFLYFIIFQTLFGVGVVGWPNGITIDFQEERIFFADAKLDYIASADLDGSNMRKIISNSVCILLQKILVC